jgi:hypothetical protein
MEIGDSAEMFPPRQRAAVVAERLAGAAVLAVRVRPADHWSGRPFYALAPLILLAACQTASTVDVSARPAASGPITLILQPCTDRTGTPERDLAAEATQAFKNTLANTKDFVVTNDGRYRLICEVADFRAGSAFERWLVPGLGQTVGKVSAMVTDTKTGQTETTVIGEARVSTGGLYTIGADSYIVPTAVDEVVRKLEAWLHGEVGDGISSRRSEYAPQSSEAGT